MKNYNTTKKKLFEKLEKQLLEQENYFEKFDNKKCCKKHFRSRR